MNDLSEIQKELTQLLAEKGLAREEIFSIMLCLTNEDKAQKVINAMKNDKDMPFDALFELVGSVAYGDENKSSEAK